MDDESDWVREAVGGSHAAFAKILGAHRGFDGAIDHLRIYPRVLSAAEIKTLATATAP